MLKKHNISILIWCNFAVSFCFGNNPLYEISNFGSNPGNLKLYNYFPSSTKNKPLVIVLHGCSQNATGIDEITDWASLSEQYDFVVFFPQQKILNNVNLCFNWFLDDDINNNGECQSIYQMMRYAIDSLQTDSTKIFIYGVSAGACMAQVICANYPWLINKAAICAGIPFKTATGLKALSLLGKTQVKTAKEWGDLVLQQNSIEQVNYPSIIIVHGTNDFVANYGYSQELIKQWTYVHNIKSEPSEIYIDFENNPHVERQAFLKNQSEKVVFYKLIGLGHQLPVNPGDDEKQGGKEKLFSKNIHFFLTYYLAKDFDLIP